MTVFPNLIAYCEVCRASLCNLLATADRCIPRIRRWRSGPRLVFLGILLLLGLLVGQLSGGDLDRGTLVQANTIHRQAAAASEFAEKSLTRFVVSVTLISACCTSFLCFPDIPFQSNIMYSGFSHVLSIQYETI